MLHWNLGHCVIILTTGIFIQETVQWLHIGIGNEIKYQDTLLIQ